MKNFRFNVGLAAMTALSASIPPAVAQGITAQPRAALGSQYFDYNRDSATSDINTEANYIFGGLGVTGQVGKFFVDLYGQTNLDDGDGDDPDAGSGRETDLSRKEINLTGGFAITTNLTAFAGLKYAELEMDHEFNSGTTIDVETDYFGPFGGLAFTYPISGVGAVSLNGSLAYLDGEEKIDNSNLVSTEVNDGTSVGFAVGLGWAGRFGSSLNSLGYGVGLDYSAYKFDGDVTDFDEKTARFRGELKYRF